ncbi:Glucose-6-phosphate 1-dehydrogenase [Candidatus Burkholderia pumila]|uniref:Glucose-6-phosphate 1-dehydrogenase n=1 Tax=Candidatus Burkholderia pumila TaxID=1090375 RepID=A0ABR5HL92_9BURK|nr:Glucose-6-phosphate 1-dehydrogenase [Candidatus Burkholderia pumila]
MEPPNSFDAEAVRGKKADVFEAMQPLSAKDVVFGQYETGPPGPGYRGEKDVAKDSRTETYAAARVFYIENGRWAGVPFLLFRDMPVEKTSRPTCLRCASIRRTVRASTST